MPDYIGAIDQGTTSTRFMVFDRAGRIAASAQKEHEQIYPQPGWVEHDPDEIWFRTQQVIAEAMAQAGLRPRDLAAIGITNQRETSVLWNRKTGRPMHQRAGLAGYANAGDAVSEFSREGGPDRFRAKTGLPLSTYFSSLKDPMAARLRSGRAPAGRSGRAAVRQPSIPSWFGGSPADRTAGCTSPIAPTPAARS